MAKTCITHPKEPSVALCSQCQKPVCKSCVMVAPHGSFCSSECSVVFRELKQRAQAEGKKKMGSATKVALFFIIMLGAFVIIHLVVVVAKVGSLKGIDLIGAFLPASPTSEGPPVQNK